MEDPSQPFLGGQGQQRPQNPSRFQNRGPPQPLQYEAGPQNQPSLAKVNLEELLVMFMGATDNKMNTVEAAQRNQEFSIRNLEKSSFTSNTEVNPREHVNVVPIIVKEKSTKEAKKKSSGGSAEQDRSIAEESRKIGMTSAPSEQKVLKYARYLRDMITKKDKLLHEQEKKPGKGEERTKKDEKGRQFSSNVKDKFKKWVPVRQVREAKVKKDPNKHVWGGAFST
ncbi:hypothetical protein M9H77_17816 [Catharanthus roseus]|uniref:Uncharacterized protein n=1 Tax=Catharanthus roseus TaxID=4058 RepID=A0ACC0B5Q8_CATRO|nr:hypothetical protein M9H77_17816 [Catharanthus roseus]